MTPLERNGVEVSGAGTRPVVFIHGYGCDRNMWRFVVPSFADTNRIVLYDLTGYGKSDLASYDRAKYSTLEGHAADAIEICETLDLRNITIVGHSVGATIAALAANNAPDRITGIVMVGPSPCYINSEGYTGGFSRDDVDGMLEMLDANYLGWSRQMAPAIMGAPGQPDLGEELTNSFCRTEPDIAKHFARVTFLSDHRSDMKVVNQPALVLQCSSDIIAPVTVGRWLAENMPDATLIEMAATGHCPHMSAPNETVGAISRFLG